MSHQAIRHILEGIDHIGQKKLDRLERQGKTVFKQQDTEKALSGDVSTWTTHIFLYSESYSRPGFKERKN